MRKNRPFEEFAPLSPKELIMKSPAKGFTLIELLIVMVIIGITISFALIAFGDFGDSKRILFAAEQVENTLRLAQQQATIEGTAYGLHIDSSGYQILKLVNGSSWRINKAKSLYKKHYFPSTMIVRLKTNFKGQKSDPNIIVDSTGDFNSFTLDFGTAKEHTIVSLIGNDRGELTLSSAKNK
jgi:general secretion pathway protein H